MPIKIPSGLPARDILDSERIFALEKPEAERQRVRPLKLVILNLMPKKIETETQLRANNAKIRQYGMGASPAYGVLSKTPSWKLRQIFNQLLAEGYLKTTPDSYMIVKLTEKSEALIAGQETFTMKMAKEPEKEAKTTPKKKVKKTAGLVLNKEQEESFEILRALRAEIAREEKVPPYIVFSDKTLVQMCIEKPTNKNAMLKVSGVGEFKFEKYGERFLEVIRSWT